MALSTVSLQGSMLALFVLIAPALVADEVADGFAGASDVQIAASRDMPSFELPEVVVTADRLAPVSLPEVVIMAERLAPLSLPEAVVVADRFTPDARLVQADTLQSGQVEFASSVPVIDEQVVLSANETVQP